MKKLFCAAFAVIMACVMLTLCVSAAGGSASLSADASSVKQGDAFSVSVSVAEATGVETVGVIPSYDKSVLEFTGAKWLIGTESDMPVVDMSVGAAVFAFKTTGDIGGSVLTLNFKVKNDAELKAVTIGATVKVDGETLSTSSASVTVVCAHSYTETVDAKYLKSEATCTAKAVYYKSCSKCKEASTTEFFESGELGGHKYDQEKVSAEYLKSVATCVSKATYYKSCKCGAKGSEFFVAGELLAHSFTQHVTEQRFLVSGATCISKAVYYSSCVCGAKGTETFEYGDILAHSFETEWRTDATSHWHQCTACGYKTDLNAHVAGDAATETTPQVCTVCAYVITPAVGHTHKYSTEWSSNSDSHWYACEGCSEHKDEAAHSYDNNCDTDCNVCGYVRTITHDYSKELSTDAEKHWYKCNVCGAKTEEAAHVPGAEATEESAQTCTVCGYVIKAALEHTHSFGDEWKKDETNHWQECKCGETSGLAAHAWNGGTVTTEPTVDTEGVKTYTCETCGAEKTEAIEKLPADNDGDNEPTESEPTESEPTGNDKKKGCSNSISAGIGFVVIALSSALAFVFKKKED